MAKTTTCLLVLLTTAVSAQNRDEWRAIYLADEHVGYERTRYRVDDGRVVSQRETRVRTRGFKINWSERTEADFATATLKTHMRRTARAPYETTIGEASGGLAIAETVKSGRSTSKQVPADIRSPFWFQRQLVGNPMPPRSRLRFSIWEDGEVREVTATSRSFAKTRLPDGTQERLLPLTMRFADRPDERRTMLMRENGEVVLSEFQYEGVTLKKRLVPAAAARTTEDQKLFDIALAQFVPGGQSLKGGRDAETASYIVNGPASMLQSLHHVPRQLSKAATDGAIELKVRMLQPRENAAIRRVHSDYLKSTKLLDHRDINVQTFAREASAGEFQPAAVARKLQRAVGAKIKNRTFSSETSPASEILNLKRGDCTEHAVLLAAALRARRIPSRVVAGLVYLDGKNGFSGHMWTEAMLNGQWTAFDATFARKRLSKEATRVPGAGYIAVSHSALEDGETILDVFMPVADLMQEASIEIVR